VFRGDLRRAARSKQCVRKFFAAVRLGEPPSGGVDQGEALNCGQVRLTLAKDCYGGPALPVRDNTRAARSARHHRQAQQRLTPAAVTGPAPPGTAKSAGERSVILRSTPVLPGRPTEHARAQAEHRSRGFLPVEGGVPPSSFHHLTVIEH
jgi:hypothetical protein